MNRTRPRASALGVIFGIVGALCALTGAAGAQARREPGWATIERQFRTLPPEARRLTGPLFWLHGDESRERLRMYVGKVAEGGNGSFTAESRPHSDWLGEGWFRDLDICLQAAKRQSLQMWIFDEKWWPSGEVAGRVPPRYGTKRLVADATDVTGPMRVTRDGCGGLEFIAAVAGRATAGGEIEGRSLVDLAPHIRGGTLAWDAPPGDWKVMVFRWRPAGGGRIVVDGASRDCVDWYIRTVYQPHYDRFKQDFGKSIAGFFYDEPETHGDWGTEVMRVLAARGVDWKRALVSCRFTLAGEEQAAARYQYRDAFAEAWGHTLYGGLSRWCNARGVKSIGHFLEHANLYLHPDLCAGNVFQLMKYSDMGGIDAVFTQFRAGQRVAQDAPCWQTPKLGSSISHVYGKPDDVAMVEIYGARGQDLTYPEMKWWADHMHVSGVSFLIPHSFNPRAPRDSDCPPYFYNGGFEPRWPLYRVFADYTSRLSVMLTGGRHACPVALLYLGNSAHAGRYVAPDGISEALQDALYDCDWMPYDVFESDTKLAGREIRLRKESYRVLVVPPVEVIPYGALAKAKRFFEQGGVVVGYGFLPTKSATLGRTARDIAALREAVWGDARPGPAACRVSAKGGRAYLLPEKPTPEQLQKVLAVDAGVRPTLEVVSGRTDHWLHVLHRVKAGRDVFFVCNQNLAGGRRAFRLRITAAGVPERWDAMRSEITAVPYTRRGRQVELTLALEPSESALLVFQPARRALPLAGSVAARAVRPVARLAVAPPPAPKLDLPDAARLLRGCSWVWYPEGNPTANAPAGTRFFRRVIEAPAGRRVKKAVFAGTADNSFVLYVNGAEAGRSDDSANGWSNPVSLDVTARLRPGPNVLALACVNATDRPSPAGLIGRLTLEFEMGAPLAARVDGTWKAFDRPQPGWMEAGFDDQAWPAARETARLGEGPWGRLAGMLTLSPARADPFVGRVMVPASWLRAGSRVCLEMEGLSPEATARVTVNGRYAGGFIERPYRLDVTRRLKAGANTLRIEPFAPRAARLVLYGGR